MTPAAQLKAALKLTVNKKGHLDSCSHGAWSGPWDNRTQHECGIDGCDLKGQPCTVRCATVQLALRLPIDAEVSQ